jgi:hypothetical protein
MPRFYFDIDDGRFIPDDEGTDLPNVEAARREGLCTAAEMAKAIARDPKPLAIHIRDQSGRPRATVRLSLTVEAA